MNNLADLETVFANELQQWFPKQCRNLYDDYYLYFLPSTAEHDGGIIITKDRPANGDYQLSQRIPKHLPIDVIKDQFRNVLRTLPVLSVK